MAELTGPARNDLLEYLLPPMLNYRYKLHRIRTDALTAIRRDVDLESGTSYHVLQSLIELYDGVAADTTQPGMDKLGKYVVMRRSGSTLTQPGRPA